LLVVPDPPVSFGIATTAATAIAAITAITASTIAGRSLNRSDLIAGRAPSMAD
jgi:hypothetical protein